MFKYQQHSDSDKRFHKHHHHWPISSSTFTRVRKKVFPWGVVIAFRPVSSTERCNWPWKSAIVTTDPWTTEQINGRSHLWMITQHKIWQFWCMYTVPVTACCCLRCMELHFFICSANYLLIYGVGLGYLVVLLLWSSLN